MPLDAKAKQFLGDEPVHRVPAQHSAEAAKRIADYRNKEFIHRAGTFYEDLMGFFVEQKRKNDYLDDEAVGAIALFAINAREAYGSPQNETERAKWTPAMREEKLRDFDAICANMQTYYDENS